MVCHSFVFNSTNPTIPAVSPRLPNMEKLARSLILDDESTEVIWRGHVRKMPDELWKELDYPRRKLSSPKMRFRDLGDASYRVG